MEHPYTNQLLYIKRNVINVLLRNSYSEPFKIPVNPEALHVPQYPKLIKCPMDLGTIKMKLDKQIYQTANECKNDFLDIFRNCYIFNEPGSLYVEMALKLENLFKRKMADLPVPEHYGIDTAFHTPKTNKVKKRKSIKLHNNIKPNVIINGSGTPINQISKSGISSQKRVRPEPNSLSNKEEPIVKKTKFGIDIKSCKHIILSLISKKYNNINRYFLEPVDVEGLKLLDYFDIVKKPMDLGTVKRKLFEGFYQTNEQFGEDVKLIFKNCYLYNPEGHEVNRCGKLLEGVFLELYHNAFLNCKKSAPSSVPITPNCDDLQPLLQKILKRQSEIDSMHEHIIKQNREIQQSIDHLNASELIKLFKATVHQNHTPTNPVVEVVKKQIPVPTSYESSSKAEKTFSPKQSLIKSKSEQKVDSTACKINSSIPNTPQKSSIDTSKSEKLLPVKKDVIKTATDRLTETKKSVKQPALKSQPVNNNVNEETPKISVVKKPLNHINNHLVSDSTINSCSESVTEYPKTQLKSGSPIETSKSIKNKEAFNVRLKEIKTWIGSLSVEMGMKVREFINKSENKNVVSVSLLKLKPVTLNGLYKMMMEPLPEPQKGVEPVASKTLKEFTIEDRMQLSQDLRLLGEKCSEKILNIYKKTEDVQSLDGECEIDFHTIKLVTLHSLREFADKCLQKKLLKKGAVTAGQPVGNNEGDSDSHSSDSSDSDASDSNSDASSSSDNEFFNSLKKTAPATEQNSQIFSASVISEIPVKAAVPESSKTPLESQPALNQLSQPEKFINNTNGESRLTDSSDSDKEEDDDKKDNTPKRPIYSALWNKSSSADNKKSLINNSSLKPKSLSIPHPMYSNTNTKQLSEGLRQIVQNAQALENVKKQEEELRLVRLKQDEEQKMQHILKMQALNESRKQLHFSENQKREEDLIRMKEMSINDSKQRALEIPCVLEREDYHQILCDFEYNINPDLIRKLVELDQSQILF